jgi:hypothetical protein
MARLLVGPAGLGVVLTGVRLNPCSGHSENAMIGVLIPQVFDWSYSHFTTVVLRG